METTKIYISSQSGRIQEIVDEKREAKDYDVMVVSIGSHLDCLGYDEAYVVVDGHHSHEAAMQDGVEPNYIVIDDYDGLTDPEKILEARYIDTGWYDINTNEML